MADSRIIFQLDAFLLGNTVMFAHSGKQFGLFDGVNAQIGFHIQIQIQHIFRIAGLFGHHSHNFITHLGRVQFARRRFRRRLGRRSRHRGNLGRRSRSRYGFHCRGYLSRRGRRLRRGRLSRAVRRVGVRHGVFNNGANRRVVFQLHAFLFGDMVRFAHNGKQFGLFDRINTQIGFHIQIQIQHILRIAGLFGNDI